MIFLRQKKGLLSSIISYMHLRISNKKDITTVNMHLFTCNILSLPPSISIICLYLSEGKRQIFAALTVFALTCIA